MDPIPCPDRGQELVASGQRSRTMVSQCEQPLSVTRAYLRCPACGAGLFPFKLRAYQWVLAAAVFAVPGAARMLESKRCNG